MGFKPINWFSNGLVTKVFFGTCCGSTMGQYVATLFCSSVASAALAIVVRRRPGTYTKHRVTAMYPWPLTSGPLTPAPPPAPHNCMTLVCLSTWPPLSYVRQRDGFLRRSLQHASRHDSRLLEDKSPPCSHGPHTSWSLTVHTPTHHGSMCGLSCTSVWSTWSNRVS